ncbi:MAG: threonine dehydratase [Hyphomonadaceae bacterium]|nr:threonine dehydratase [Hyphomonadaceae bacterium]
MITRDDLDEAWKVVRGVFGPTPAYAWPLLAERAGHTIVVKHENHCPTGAFKVRGGLVFLARLRERMPACPGLVTATRGNHGQSIAFAASRTGVPLTIVVPHGNSREKNAAMRAFGADLIEHGRDFDEARVHAARLGLERGLVYAPSFHPDLVAGVATYAVELFGAHPDVETVYVPVGLGSGVCAVTMVRDLFGLPAKIVGVVSEKADCYALSFESGAPVETPSADTFADGLAVRVPNADAFGIIKAGVDRIVRVSDAEIAAAMRILHEDTHNMAEGAGAAALAAALKERVKGKAAVILSGANVDREIAAKVLAG